MLLFSSRAKILSWDLEWLCFGCGHWKLLVVGGFLPFAAESVLDNGGWIAGCFHYLGCFGNCSHS